MSRVSIRPLVVDLAKAAKAATAGVVAGVGSLAVGYVDDSLTTGEAWTAAAVAAAAAAAVYGIRNRPDGS